MANRIAKATGIELDERSHSACEKGHVTQRREKKGAEKTGADSFSVFGGSPEPKPHTHTHT